MKVVPGPDGWPQAFEYTVSGQSVRFDQSAAQPPILHLTLFNPLDDYYGLSPLEAAAIAVDTHNAAASWNKALLDNAARPSGALVYAGAGGRGAGRRAIRAAEKGIVRPVSGLGQCRAAVAAGRRLDWKPMSLSPKDMDFMEAKHRRRARSRWPSACRRC